MSILKKRLSAGVVVVMAAILVISSFVAWAVVEEHQEQVEESFLYLFYNDTSPADQPHNNSGDVLDAAFTSDILSAAPAEVRANPTKFPEWFKEDLLSRIYDHEENSGDPALLAQLSLDAMLRAPKTVSEKLLPTTEQSTEQWTATVLRFVGSSGDHISTAGMLQAVWNRAESFEVRAITGGYTSSGYMIRDGITLSPELAAAQGRNTVPQPILKDSRGTKGYEIVFRYKNGETLSYRINCGYQPDASDYPSGGKTPGYKPPDVTITVDEPTPSPSQPPGGGDDPTPIPPKVPGDGPQGQNPNVPDYGDSPNQGTPDGPNSEVSSPPTYESPSTPVPAPSTSAPSGGSDTPTVGDHNEGNTENVSVDNNGDGSNDGTFTGDVTTGSDPADSLDGIQASPAPAESGTNTTPGGNGALGGPPA